MNWFSPPKKKADTPGGDPANSGLSRLEASKPQGGPRPSSSRKQERLERRELLYAVVRESMVRAGVLSSSYKFKVLSLDPRGAQFMVMVDLAQGAGSDTRRLSEIEASVTQSAKARYDIAVSAVYWRASEHVAIGDPAHPTHPARLAQRNAQAQPPTSRPAPLHPDAIESGPAPLYEPMASRPSVLRSALAQKFDPLQQEEVAAFRKALEAGVRGEQALAAVGAGKAAQSYTLLTGFEDTEMSDQAAPQEHLSSTQYGALR
ncbi:hypothetical protein WG902_05050 [Ramlibacter sp. PS3R-8]|uniref:hypothetical protein n=1 Tax=Ramlibacter sp. PS3R-8 TaxID=3133437 RepID=UPI0030AEFF88